MTQVLELNLNQREIYEILGTLKMNGSGKKGSIPRIGFSGSQQNLIKEFERRGVKPEYERYGEGSLAAMVTIDIYKIRAKEPTGHNPNIFFYAPDEKDPLYRALEKKLQPEKKRRKNGARLPPSISGNIVLLLDEVPTDDDSDPLERYSRFVADNKWRESES